MGGSVSRLGRWSVTSSSSSKEPPEGRQQGREPAGVRRAAIPLVYTRRGSMYRDEDGDVAHEFFEQVPDRQPGRTRMRRVSARRLQPQGTVRYQFPRLHVDFPIVLYRD